MNATRVAACSLALVAALSAQDVPPWRFVHATQITGTSTFGADEIRWGLCASPGVLEQLARAADDAARARLLVALVTEGYRGAGYPAVAVNLVEGAPRALRVSEGPRGKAGRLLVTGNTALTTEALAAALAKPKGDWAGWPPRRPPACDAVAVRVIEDIVLRAYADLAHYGVDASCRFVATGDTVDLVVTVRNEGHAVRVGELLVVGETPENLPMVRERIHVAGDALLTLTELQSLRSQFEELGRYTAIEFPSMAELAEQKDGLSVRVQPAPFAPKMAAMPWQDVAQLRAGLRTIHDHLAGGKVVETVVDLPVAAPFAGFTMLPGPITIVVGQGGAAVHCERLQLPDGTTTTADLLLGDTAAFAQFGDGKCGVAEYERIACQLRLWTSPGPDGGMQLRWGVGWAMQAQPAQNAADAIVVSFHPLTALALLQREVAHRDGDDMIVDLLGAAIDRQGKVRPSGADQFLSWRLKDGTFADEMQARRQRFPVEQTMAMGAYVLTLAARHGPTMLGGTTPAQADAMTLVRRLASLPPIDRRDAAPVELFLVPLPSAPKMDWLEQLAAAIARNLPADSWATTLWLSSKDIARRTDGAAAARRVYALGEDPAFGPLALAASSILLVETGYSVPGQRLRKLAEERWQAGAAFADVRALAAPGSPLRVLFDRCGMHWRTDPALAALFADLPEKADDLAIFERAFHRCWEAGLGDLLRSWLLERD